MKGKIIVQAPVAVEGINLLRESGFEIEEIYSHDFSVFKKAVTNSVGILSRPSACRISDEILQSAKELKVVGIHGVGLDNIDLKTATERGIVVCFAPLANMQAVVEHTIALMLSLLKQIPYQDKIIRDIQFKIRDELISQEIEGLVLGVIGLGNIGSTVAAKLKAAFNLRVIGFDPFISDDKKIKNIELINDLDQLLGQSDIITIHCPLTPDTRGLIGEKEFNIMKKSAYIVNVARGGIIKEKELYEALKNKKIKGAALDVFENEPPEHKNPLFELDNVILTPHTAWLTNNSKVNMAMDAARGIINVLNGKRPKYLVNEEVYK